MTQPVEWHNYHLKRVKVIFKPRLKYETRGLKPGIIEHINKELIVRPCWLMSETDAYPGEWALGPANPSEYLLPNIHWIASGDVEFVEEVE